MTSDDLVARLLAPAAADYARELPAKASALLDLVRRVRAGDDDAAAALAAAAHRLAGSAGSYGFPTIGAAARDLELLAIDHVSRDDARWRALADALADAVADVA